MKDGNIFSGNKGSGSSNGKSGSHLESKFKTDSSSESQPVQYSLKVLKIRNLSRDFFENRTFDVLISEFSIR